MRSASEAKLISAIDGMETTWYLNGSGRFISVRILVKHQGFAPEWWGNKRMKIRALSWLSDSGKEYRSYEMSSTHYPKIRFKQGNYILYFSGDVPKLPNATRLKQVNVTVEIEGIGLKEIRALIPPMPKPLHPVPNKSSQPREEQ